MFRGKYLYTIDNKGRLSLPPKFKELLGVSKEPKIVITNAISNSSKFLDLYPLAAWEEIEKKTSLLSQVDPKVQNFQRYYLSSAQDLSLDKQGRVLIPQDLRTYAQLGKEVMLVGMLKKIEIWSKEKWDKVFEEAEKNFEHIVKDLSSLGL